MSNDYFNDTSAAADFTRARAAQVNDVSAAVETSFDLLPNLTTFRAVAAKAVAAGGTADAITITNTFAQTAYNLGNRIAFKATATSTAAVTVNVDGLGVKSLKGHGGAALAAGAIVNGSIYEAIYNGTEFRLSGGVLDSDIAASAASAAAAAVSAGTATTQAGIATTQAGLAATAKTNAETAETNAETAQTAAEVARDAAQAAAIPSQTGNSGKYLTTNGTAASWATLAGWTSLGTINAASLSGQTSVSFTSIDTTTYASLMVVGAVTPSASPTLAFEVNDGSDTETVAEASATGSTTIGLLIHKAGSANPMCIATFDRTAFPSYAVKGRVPTSAVSPITRINIKVDSGTFNNAGGLTLYGRTQ